jgi:hypothetical protein
MCGLTSEPSGGADGVRPWRRAGPAIAAHVLCAAIVVQCADTQAPHPHKEFGIACQRVLEQGDAQRNVSCRNGEIQQALRDI